MLKGDFDQFRHYPESGEIDSWVGSIRDLADRTTCRAELMGRNGFSHSLGVNHVDHEFTFVKFSPEGMDDFYGYWQPVMSGPAPLLVHVPGYGAEMSMHPDLVSLGYNVLHISPLGYATPDGPSECKKRKGDWPVLPDTVVSGAEKGYKLWLADCIMAVCWAMSQSGVIPGRVSFFGTSQGGGGALLLGSLFKDKGVRCVAADLPFLTNFPMADGRGAYCLATQGLGEAGDKAAGWRALGFVDTLSHAHRLNCPVLLTAGGMDDVCPPETVESLFEVLPGTKSLTFLKNQVHRYSREFIPLASAWFRIYA